MPLFEVFIPTTEPDGFNITARVRADSWIQALRNGLARMGDTADVRNVLVDIREQGIDVTEPRSGRVFRIRDLGDATAETSGTQAPEAAPAAPAPARIVAAPIAAAPSPAVKESAPLPKPAPVVPGPLVAGAQRFQGTAGIQEETVKREKAVGPPKAIGRAKGSEQVTPVEDLLAELFDATTAVFSQPSLSAAANFVLDLAMRTVPADAGSVFVADLNASDLYFAAARGPKAKDVMRFRVPMGQGIVGFCAQEGVSLAVSDVNRDPHFCAAISQKIGYETRSIACSPAQLDGRVFGALQLINKKSGATFTRDEVTVLDYLARQFADYLSSTGQGG